MTVWAGGGRPAFALATVAVAWAAGFTWWALTAHVYSDGQTILEANAEPAVRVAIAVPLVVSAVVWVSLHIACRTNSRRPRRLGFVLASLLLFFAVISGFSIGMFIFPGAAALTVAAALTPVASR